MSGAVELKTSSFAWSPKSEEAAQLIAMGELSYPEIAERVGAARSTLWEWRRIPEFAARIEEHQEEIRAEIRRRGIGVIDAGWPRSTTVGSGCCG